jgi:hypothetical protein
MNANRLLLAALCLSPLPVHAQDAVENSDVQVAFYQLNIEAGCKEAGHRSGSPDKDVAAFCGCMLKTLRADLTTDEWRSAYAYASRHEPENEMKVLAPHLQKVGACRDAGA